MTDDLEVHGELRAHDFGPGEALLKVSGLYPPVPYDPALPAHMMGRVTIGGGGAVALLTVGNRSPSQIQVTVDDSTIRLRGRMSTATSADYETQALLLLTTTDWDGTESRDLHGVVATRADLKGSCFFIFESPGNEMAHLFPEGRLVIRQHPGQDIPGIEITDNVTQEVTAAFGPAYILPGASILPEPTAAERGQVRRVEGGPGVADALYVCIKDATDAYVWQPLGGGVASDGDQWVQEGAAGPEGPEGPAGPQGPAGPAGPKGPAGSIVVSGTIDVS